MEESFDLPIDYKGEERILSTSLLLTRYTRKFTVEIDGQPVIFERDEEHNYRAFIPGDGKPVERELLQVIAERLKEVFE